MHTNTSLVKVTHTSIYGLYFKNHPSGDPASPFGHLPGSYGSGNMTRRYLQLGVYNHFCGGTILVSAANILIGGKDLLGVRLSLNRWTFNWGQDYYLLGAYYQLLGRDHYLYAKNSPTSPLLTTNKSGTLQKSWRYYIDVVQSAQEVDFLDLQNSEASQWFGHKSVADKLLHLGLHCAVSL